jgi:dihydropteroate synthase
MGILNTTPDSFSDGGRYLDVDTAIARGLKLADEGADIIDIGGESTRPGAAPVDEQTELDRVIPVVAGLAARTDVLISIDTMKPTVALAAVAAGAGMWNDVTALTFAPDSLATAVELACPVVLMHWRRDSFDERVVDDVVDYLAARASAALAAGVAREHIWLDPGIGFAKTPTQSLAILRALDRVVALGFPVLLGASRKRLISHVDPTASSVAERLGGSIALALAGARAGVAAVRVHDVRETRQALLMQEAIHG